MANEIVYQVPTLEEFEITLLEISQIASVEVNRIFELEKAKGNVENGYHIKGDSSATGSTVLHLKKRSLLFKFFNSIPENNTKFYYIFIYGNQVRIDLCNIKVGQSYELKLAAYDIVVKMLREKYSWEIYNDVKLD